jgi:mRNA interferase RelE/StbE
MYQILIERKAQKELENLPSSVIDPIISALNNLKINPWPHGAKKLVDQDGWRIRIRDYRILYTVDHQSKIIKIYRIKHRKDAYR